MRKIVLLIFILLTCQNVFAVRLNDVESEKMIILLELQLQAKIKRALNTVLDISDIHISVSAKMDKRNSLLDENFERSQFDYLPLLVRDQVGVKKSYAIDSYLIRVVSASKLSIIDQQKISKIIDGELSNRKHELNFVVIMRATFLDKTIKFWDNNIRPHIFFALGLIICSILIMLFLFWATLKVIALFRSENSFFNKIHRSKVEELIKFIRDSVSKDKDIIKKVIIENKKDILGVKSLIPYLSSQFCTEEIIPKPILIRIVNEDRYLSEEKFISWLRDISERVATVAIKEGSNLKKNDINDLILVKFRNLHPDLLVKALKEINDPSVYGVAFRYINDVKIDEVMSKFDTPVWDEVDNTTISNLNHNKILKMIIKEVKKSTNHKSIDEIPKKNITDQPPEININKHENLQNNHLDNITDWLSQIPGSYLEQKLIDREIGEIAEILNSLSDSNRYVIISNMQQDQVNEAVKRLEAKALDENDSSVLDSFLEEIKHDYQNGKFQIDEKKIA
jgi:hypothetical protein